MENKARYAIVGMFTLAVLAAGFIFVYWLYTGGGLQKHAYYRVRYENSVAGLIVGSAVQFNGVRVGEVSALELDANSPKDITVTIAVAPDTPIRADTKASIAFQGLMGSPAVSLSGGTSSAIIPSDSTNAVPLLNADPGAGQTMSEVALAAIHRIDSVVSDNAAPLKNTISNLSKFTDALGRNSDRVDGILAGLERMTGGSSKVAPPVFYLTAAQTFPKFEKPNVGLLVVNYPTAPATVGQDKILIKDAGGLRAISADAKWDDMLLDQIQAKFIQSFENAGFLSEVSRPIEGATADFQLASDIRNFEIDSDGSADVTFSARILSNDGHILGARLFEAKAPTNGNTTQDAATAVNAAFNKSLPDLIVWTSSIIADARSAAR